MNDTILDASPTEASHRYAGFWRRFVAHIIDSLFVSIIVFTFQSVLGQNPFSYLSAFNNPQKLELLRSSPSYIIAEVIGYIVYIFYLIIFWVQYDGATPGKRLLGIQIVQENNQKITLPTAVVRVIGMILSAIPLGLGYLWVIWDKKKQAWHDKLAKTIVIRTDTATNIPLVALLFLMAFLFQIFLYGSAFVVGLRSTLPSTTQRAQMRQSVRTYQQASEELPAEAKTHFDRSQEIFRQMKESSNDPVKVRSLNDENIRELKAALVIASDSARLWYELGNAYTWVSSEGTLQDGLAAYGRTEELEPNNMIYIATVGDMLIRLEKYQDAIIQLQKALRISNNYAYPEYLIGVAYKNLRIYDEARTHLTKAIEIYQNSNDNGQLDDEILAAQQQLASIPKE